ncbi:MAG: hypothetical protein ACRD6W_17690, partial [Nitrososphaerales archaeon]
FTQTGGEVAVTIPDEAFLVEGLQFIKRGIANDIMHFVPEAKKVTFTESYAKKEDAKKAASAAEAEKPEAVKKEEAKQTA